MIIFTPGCNLQTKFCRKTDSSVSLRILMKSPPEDPFFTQMKTIYIYHHVYGQPSIEHPVEEYNPFCYLEPAPEIIDLRNSTSFNQFVDEDCSSVHSSEFHKTDIKTNNCDTNVVSSNTSDSGSNVTSSTKKTLNCY